MHRCTAMLGLGPFASRWPCLALPGETRASSRLYTVRLEGLALVDRYLLLLIRTTGKLGMIPHQSRKGPLRARAVPFETCRTKRRRRIAISEHCYARKENSPARDGRKPPTQISNSPQTICASPRMRSPKPLPSQRREVRPPVRSAAPSAIQTKPKVPNRMPPLYLITLHASSACFGS